jgi:hypothetical protein
MRQGDLFETETQEDGARRAAAYVFKPNLEKIRAELRGVVAKARASQDEPWDAAELRYYQTVLPQMSRWLPDDERAELIRAFEAEVARLGAA